MVRMIRALHGWLAILIVPWVLMMGVTGLYLNHPETFKSFLPDSDFDETLFDVWPTAAPVDEAGAKAIAVASIPDARFKRSTKPRYHGRDVIRWDSPDGDVIVVAATGHYWVKKFYTRTTYSPEGRRLDTRVYWSRLFRRLHQFGWYDKSLGTFFSDLTGVMMIVFGLTGIVLFFTRKSASAAGGSVSVRRSGTPRPQRLVLRK